MLGAGGAVAAAAAAAGPPSSEPRLPARRGSPNNADGAGHGPFSIASAPAFPFPYTPYGIQQAFMANLYACLRDGAFGIFESPTGTGKTQSLINGSFTWLRDHRAGMLSQHGAGAAVPGGGVGQGGRHTNGYDGGDGHGRGGGDGGGVEAGAGGGQQPVNGGPSAPGSAAAAGPPEGGRGSCGCGAPPPSRPTLPAWVFEASRKRKLEEVEAVGDRARQRHARAQRRAHRRIGAGVAHSPATLQSDPLLLDDPVEATDGKAGAAAIGMSTGGSNLSAATLRALEEADTSSDDDDGDSEDDVAAPKIIFASRTHTQLAQFVGEVKKTVFWRDPEMRVVQLAARHNLCLNSRVLASSSGCSDKLNDLCTKIGGGQKASQCHYGGADAIRNMRQRLDARAMDIEELKTECRRHQACPYFVTKAAVDRASVIALPYSALLSTAARTAFGVDVEDNVVIVDEGHNVMDAVNAAHSVEITLASLKITVGAVSAYLAKYCNRLHVRNKVRLRQLVSVLKKLAAWMAKEGGGGGAQNPQPSTQQQQQAMKPYVLSATAFAFAAGIEGVNAPELARFSRESKLFRKLQGFLDAAELADNEAIAAAARAAGTVPEFKRAEKATVAQMYAVDSFLYQALVGDEAQARLLFVPDAEGGNPALRLVSIFAGDAFAPIVRGARAVVLAGGTMTPVEDVTSELIPQIPPARVRLFQCGHVIPPHHVLPMTVAASRDGVPFDFRYASRSDTRLLTALFHTVVDLARATPGGLILFFPSYGYEAEVFAAWDRLGLLARLTAVKPLFREPKRGEGDVNEMLNDYQTACGTPKGAVLSSVVGGKLSEGINFADDYGRCVVVVGLPYPNPSDPLLVEKQKLFAQRCATPDIAGKMLDIMCMKAVNQSIGRAIRHRNDYAALILLDRRYLTEKIFALIPAWIRGSARRAPQFTGGDDLKGFFAAMARETLASKNSEAANATAAGKLPTEGKPRAAQMFGGAQ